MKNKFRSLFADVRFWPKADIDRPNMTCGSPYQSARLARYDALS
jgi:hypothetical protein